jgi:hypothetical protein
MIGGDENAVGALKLKLFRQQLCCLLGADEVGDAPESIQRKRQNTRIPHRQPNALAMSR